MFLEEGKDRFLLKVGAGVMRYRLVCSRCNCWCCPHNDDEFVHFISNKANIWW